MSNAINTGVGRAISAKYRMFDRKKYLRMLVTKKTCSLTHPERLVLSFRVYKTRDARSLTYSKIAHVLGLDRHTVAKVVKSLERQGVYLDNPLLVKPEWFANPHPDGTPRCYRHYFVESGLTKMENTLYWMLWSLTRSRTVVQSKSGLAILTNYSRFRVIAGIKSLVSKGLIELDGWKITLPDPPTLDYWKERTQKVTKAVVDTASEPKLSENWVAILVDVVAQGTPSDKEMLIPMVEKTVHAMKQNAHISLQDIYDYWLTVLRSLPNAEKAWEFAFFKFDYLLADAVQIHREKGQATTCIRILLHLTSQQLLSQQPSLPWLKGDSHMDKW